MTTTTTSSSCRTMHEILALHDRGWILEALSTDADAPPPRSDSRHCYWMVRPIPRGDTPLSVRLNTLEECSGNQVYRLSRLKGKEEATGSSSCGDKSSPPLPALEPHESPDIGTSVLYEDEHVKIWEFRLHPGDRCPYHRHMRPYLFLNLTPSCNQELDPQGAPVSNTLPSRQAAGQCTYVPRDKLSAHAVRNVGDGVFLQFIVEFKE